jgi:uncharacterized protein (TIGR02246 family)
LSVTAGLSPADIVQGQFEAYNAQDLDAFCAFYAPDAVLAPYGGEPHTVGLDAIRERHKGLFAQFPHNRAEILNRIVVGANVIDHERVVRAPGGETFEVSPVYTIGGGKIVRVDFIR